MRSFFSQLLMPLPLLMLLAVLALFFYFRKNRPWMLVFLVLSLAWFVIISTPLVPIKLVRSLEGRTKSLLIPPDSLDNAGIRIIVLGCGYTNDFSMSWTQQLATNELGRLVEGVRLYQKIPGSKLVLSASNVDDYLSQAETAANAALMLGVLSTDTFQLPTPTTTWEEALAYRARFKSNAAIRNPESLILVTDALHMPRALMLFRKAGLSPIPAPTNFLIKNGKTPDKKDWWPSPEYINWFGKAVHEYAGMIWSRLRVGAGGTEGRRDE